NNNGCSEISRYLLSCSGLPPGRLYLFILCVEAALREFSFSSTPQAPISEDLRVSEQSCVIHSPLNQ
ncbi:MAG: hypothetical protein OSB19_13540, partial [Opitutaceae bacterium]|nr:hypothetical protein [Opitutaceae bacterium]